MAIKLTNKTNTLIPNSDYPFGGIKDESAPGANDGTPINTNVYGDFHQFFEKLMNYGAVTHNNTPDNETNGYQLFIALQKSVIKTIQSVNFGDHKDTANLINFDTTTSGGFAPANNSVTLPSDGIKRRIMVVSKAFWNRKTVSGGNITGTHYLYLNATEVDLTKTENDTNLNYDDTTVCVHSFSHLGDGGTVDHRFSVVGDQYDITNIRLEVLGVPIA